jgi:3-hydroxyacyl-CoA dehydrogenase
MRYEKEVQQNKEQYEREMRALEDSYRKLIENERAKKLDHEETMKQISEEKHDEVNKLDA